MMEHIVIFPILFQILLSILLMFLWGNNYAQRLISILGSIFALIVSVFLFTTVWKNGIMSEQAGNWEAPFGITFVADTLSVTLVLITQLVALAVSIYSSINVISSRVKFGYFPIFHLMIMGINGAFLTGDLFNLYVFFEVIIISSFVLLTIGGRKMQIEGAVKYFALNMLSSLIFLTAIAMLYGATGTLNMAKLAVVLTEAPRQDLIQTIALIFLVGFGVKSGVFPLYFWLPASYHTPPSAVSALFGGLLTKVGVYAMIRVLVMVFPEYEMINTIVLIIAGLTIFTGAIGALVQKNIIKIFSYLIICHIGFMVAGLGMHTEWAIAGAVFYMFHDIIVKTALFMVGGLTFRISGSNLVSKMGGLMRNQPKVALLIAIPLFSLVGIPPLSGFWPKISLFGASIHTESYWTLAALIFGSFLTLFIIARLWLNIVSKDQINLPLRKEFIYYKDFTKFEKWTMVLPIILLSLVSLYIGFNPEHLQILSERIGNELMHNESYIQAVLNP